MQVGQARIWVKGAPDVFVKGWLDDATPELAGGVGGWNEIARPRRTSLMEWGGTSLYTQKVPLLLDEHASGGNVQDLVSRLEAWGRPVGKAAPPVVKIRGAGLEHVGLDWVINGLSRGDGIIDRWGRLSRRSVVVELLQFDESAFLLPSSAVKGGKTKWVPVLRGDTLKRIASRNRTTWQVLKKLNPKVRDPSKVITTQKRVQVPR